MGQRQLLTCCPSRPREEGNTLFQQHCLCSRGCSGGGMHTWWRPQALRRQGGGIRLWMKLPRPVKWTPRLLQTGCTDQTLLVSSPSESLQAGPVGHGPPAGTGCTAPLTAFIQSLPTELPLPSWGILRKTLVCDRVFWEQGVSNMGRKTDQTRVCSVCMCVLTYVCWGRAVAFCPHLLCSCELQACAHFLDKASGCVLLFTIVLTAPPEPCMVSDRQESLCLCLMGRESSYTSGRKTHRAHTLGHMGPFILEGSPMEDVIQETCRMNCWERLNPPLTDLETQLQRPSHHWHVWISIASASSKLISTAQKKSRVAAAEHPEVFCWCERTCFVPYLFSF